MGEEVWGRDIPAGFDTLSQELVPGGHFPEVSEGPPHHPHPVAGLQAH